MAVLLSQFLLLALVTCTTADVCFERFGSDQAKCNTAQGECVWFEMQGIGKCMASVRTDGCFESYGSDKVKCTDTNGLCIWVEKNGEGKCMRYKNGGDSADGMRKDRWKQFHGGAGDPVSNVVPQKSKKESSHRKGNGRKTLHKIESVFSISIGSSLASPEVIETLKQQHLLLEHALAQSQVYQKVTILGLDVARRLRAAVNTQVNVRFEAEATTIPEVDGEASGPHAQLKDTLQESFAKAGFDFQVQSATVAISSGEPMEARSDDIHHSTRYLMIVAASAGLILCTCRFLLGIFLRRRRETAAKATAAKNDLHHLHL